MMLRINHKIRNKTLLATAVVNLGALIFFGGGPLRAGLLCSLIVLCGLVNLAVATGVGAHRSLFGLPATMKVMCGLVVAYPLVQLAPLPPALWSSLPGRGLEADVLEIIGAGTRWHSISNAPLDTVYYLIMLIPLGGLYLSSLHMNNDENILLALFLFLMVLLSAAVGMVQVATAGTVFKLHASYHGSSLLGFFANRNHSALFLATGVFLAGFLCPILLRKRAGSAWIALALSVLLLGASLATGSRAGVALTALAVVISILPLLGLRRKRRVLVGAGALAGLSFFAMLLLTFSGVADRTMSRFDDLTNDRRPVIWSVSQEVAKAYFPFGSGIGTFVNSYKKHEPIDALAPTYANHAHQDYLEAVIEGGAVAIIVILAVVWTWARFSIMLIPWMTSPQKWKSDREVRLALLGSGIILLPILHSLVDYPLRRMAIMGVFVLAFAWLARPWLRVSTQQGADGATHVSDYQLSEVYS